MPNVDDFALAAAANLLGYKSREPIKGPEDASQRGVGFVIDRDNVMGHNPAHGRVYSHDHTIIFKASSAETLSRRVGFVILRDEVHGLEPDPRPAREATRALFTARAGLNSKRAA